MEYLIGIVGEEYHENNVIQIQYLSHLLLKNSCLTLDQLSMAVHPQTQYVPK